MKTMKFSLLRNLLLLDAAVLFLLGAALLIAPRQLEAVFRFKDLPEGVNYMLGLWGCVLVTMALGYIVAATNPIRHIIWIQMGIARGVLECVLGLAYLARGVVTFSQAGFGLVVAVFMATAYVALYPRRPRLITPSRTPAETTSPPV